MSSSVGSVETILDDRLNLFKTSARWFPHLLTLEQKIMHNQVLQEILKLDAADPKNFLHRLVTQDETCVPHFDPESNIKSHHWKHPDSLSSKKF